MKSGDAGYQKTSLKQMFLREVNSTRRGKEQFFLQRKGKKNLRRVRDDED